MRVTACVREHKNFVRHRFVLPASRVRRPSVSPSIYASIGAYPAGIPLRRSPGTPHPSPAPRLHVLSILIPEGLISRLHGKMGVRAFVVCVGSAPFVGINKTKQTCLESSFPLHASIEATFGLISLAIYGILGLPPGRCVTA